MNRRNESKTFPKITINDLTGLGAFYEHNNIHADLTKLDNGRVIGTVDGTAEAYRLMGEFQWNPSVRLLDFLAAQRRLRGACWTFVMGL